MRSLLVFLVFLVASGCAPRTKMLVQRATPDLACVEEKVLVVQVDDQVYEARGCGRRRQYVYACNKKGHCGWVPHNATSDSGGHWEGAQASAAPAAPKADARVETGRSSSGSKQLKLFLESAQPVSLLYVIATPGYDAERAMLMWRVPKTEPESECTIQIVADGIALPLGAETKRLSRQDSVDYQIELPYTSIATIARSTRVVGRVCATEVVLSPTQIEKARELDIRLREEQAWKSHQ